MLGFGGKKSVVVRVSRLRVKGHYTQTQVVVVVQPQQCFFLVCR